MAGAALRPSVAAISKKTKISNEPDVEAAEKRPFHQGSSSSISSNVYYAEDDDDDDTPFCCFPLKIIIIAGLLSLVVTWYSKKQFDKRIG